MATLLTAGLEPAGILERLVDGWDRSPAVPRAPLPSVDIWHTDTELHIRMALAGLTVEHVEVEIGGGMLTVTGEHPGTPDDGRTWVRREQPTGRFERSFRLPAGVDADDVQVAFERGMLHITVAHRSGPQRIPITIHDAG